MNFNIIWEMKKNLEMDQRRLDELMPWSTIDCGVTDAYLKKSLADAHAGKITPDCRAAESRCSGCGASRLLNGGKCNV